MAECLTCYKFFNPKHRNQKYCSPECRPSYQETVLYSKVCPYCHMPFIGPGKKVYCSSVCQRKNAIDKMREDYAALKRMKTGPVKETS